jgi:hypothetical protein
VSLFILSGGDPPLIALCLSPGLILRHGGFFEADRLLGQYKTVYGDDNEESVEYMCGEYANEWAALAKVLVAQREEVNADQGLNKAAKMKREVQIGAKSDLGIINMIHGLLVADAMIDSMGEEEMKSEQLVGAVQRECRDCLKRSWPHQASHPSCCISRCSRPVDARPLPSSID